MKLKPQETKLAEQLVNSLSVEFDAKQYHDEYQDKLRALIDAKAKGREIAQVSEPKRASVIDIMQALKKSLAASEAHAPAATAARQPAAAPVARRARRKAS